MTDEHCSYINWNTLRSKLCELGFFHYWTNHSAYEYIHRKFPFVTSINIEGLWGRLKKNNPVLRHLTAPEDI
jgi:hypothetical protein